MHLFFHEVNTFSFKLVKNHFLSIICFFIPWYKTKYDVLSCGHKYSEDKYLATQSWSKLLENCDLTPYE